MNKKKHDGRSNDCMIQINSICRIFINILFPNSLTSTHIYPWPVRPITSSAWSRLAKLFTLVFSTLELYLNLLWLFISPSLCTSLMLNTLWFSQRRTSQNRKFLEQNCLSLCESFAIYMCLQYYSTSGVRQT